LKGNNLKKKEKEKRNKKEKNKTKRCGLGKSSLVPSP